MSNPGKTLAGLVVVAAGIVVATVFAPAAIVFAGKMLGVWGATMFLEGVFGTPQLNPAGSKFSVTSTQAPLPVIYGERRVSHIVADVATHGTNNSWLDTMVGVCIAGESGKNIESIETIYLYPDESLVGAQVNDPWQVDNQTVVGRYDNVHSKYNKAPNWHYLYSIGRGKDSQLVDACLEDRQPGRWGSGSGIPNQEGRGIVTVYHGYFYDKDEEDNVWENGRPNDIQYDVRGALLYDPRYKTDGPDSDGWIWDKADNVSLGVNDNHPGQNPALQVLDYLTSNRYGMGIPYSSRGATWGTTDEIDEASFIAAANHCDEDVTTTGLTPNETVPRYTGNAIISTADSHKANLERLLTACNSMLAYEGGVFKIISRKVTTPVSYEITESEIIGEISMIRDGSTVPNILTVRFPYAVDRESIINWTWPYNAFDPAENGFLEADNEVPVERTVDLSGVTTKIHAQCLAMIALKEMREDVTIEVTCRESAIQLSVGDVVNVTYDSAGFSQKAFWVLGMELIADSTVKLYLKEYAASVYTLDANADIPTVPGTNLPDPFTVIAPTVVAANCAAGYYLNDGVFVPRVEITWTHSVDEFAHEEELVYRKDADAEWVFTGMKKKIADTAVITWESDLEIGEDYWFGVVAWNRIGVRSPVAETAAFCTISPPSDTPDDVTITSSDYTCLEGMTITWDDPVVYTDADTIGVPRIGFYSVEIREQGAGATELDRWTAGTLLDRGYGNEWNYPFDKTTKDTYDLSLRRFDRFGTIASGPTEVQLVLNDWPCAGFGENEPSEYGAMIHNGGFENGGRWWYSAVGGAISASSPLAESYSLAMTAGGAERICRQVSDLQDDITLGVGEDHFIKVNEGDWFVLGTYGSTTGATGRVRARTYDRDKALQATVDVVTFTSSTPIRKSAFININTDIEYLVIECSIDAGTGVAKFDAMGAWLYPPRIPTIKEIITYPTAASGKLEIEINAGTSILQSVEMKKYEDQVWDAGWTDVTPAPYDMTVALSEKHPSAIMYRVGYDLTATGSGAIEYIEISVAFDLDTLPELATPSFDVDTDTGNVILHWSGDDDVSYIKWITTDTDWGTPALARTAAQGGTVANNRSGSVSLSGTGIPIPESDAAYVAILAYTVGNIESIEVYRATVTRGSTGIIVPTIQSQMDYSGSNGTITLVINDPQTRVTQVRYDTWPGTTQAWAGWTIDPSSPWGPWSVALDEKHDSHIRWEVRYTDPSGAVFLEGNATFDVDTVPEVGSFGIAIADDGAPTLNYHGDDDVGSIEWAFEIGIPPAADQPTAAETRVSGNYNNSRSEGALPITGGTVDVGETIFVSFVAYTGTNGTGTESAILYETQETRYSSASIILPTIQAQVTGAGSDEVTLVINDPQSHVNAVGFRTYEDGTWSSWVDDTVAPYDLTQSITREEKHNTMVAWRVRYDYGPGNKYIENVIVFDPDIIPEINSVDVKVNEVGTVYLAFSGDDDCLSARYATSNSDFPSYATVIANDPAGDINASAATNINIGSLAEGQTLYLSIAAYPQTGQGGTANTDMGWGRVTRPTDTDTKYDTVPANVTTFGSLKYIRATVARIRLYWTPVTTPGVTHYEIRYGGTGWADATFETELATTGYTITYGEIPSSSRTYRIKAMNRAESLESATAATTTVSWSSRPSGGAVSLVSSYWRGTGGLMRFNLATTNGTIFRFHWGTTVGFTPTDSNVMAVITEDNPTSDYAVGLSVAESGWTDDSGRVLYCKVGVKDGASDDLGEGWSYSSGFQFTMNPFELTHIPDGGGWRKTLDTYVDSSGRIVKLYGSSGEIPANDVFDKAVDTYATIGAQSEITYSDAAPGSPGTGDMWVDTNSTPTNIYRWTGSAWDRIGNLTEGALALLDQVDTINIVAAAITETKIDNLAISTGKIQANAITTAKIDAEAVTANEIFGNTITGNQITGNTLSGIFINAGTITAGLLQNTAGTNFVDLDASGGSEEFLKAGTDFYVMADGTAYFAGEVASTDFTATTADFGNIVTQGIIVRAYGSSGYTSIEGHPIGGLEMKLETGTATQIRPGSDYAALNYSDVQKLRWTSAGIVLIDDLAIDEGTNYLQFFGNTDITAEMNTAGNPMTGGTNRGFVKWHGGSPYEIEVKNPIVVTAGVTALTNVKAIYSATDWLFLQSPKGVLIDIDSDANETTNVFRVRANKANTLMEIVENGTIYLGDGSTASNRTYNMLWIPSSVGAPTGSITAPSNGRVPLVWDSTNDRLYVRDGGGWKYKSFTTSG